MCEALVLYGRDGTGNRAGLIPPRRCRRLATSGEYCGVHAPQSDLQDLLRRCMNPSWERHVEVWEVDKKRQAEVAGRRLANRLSEMSRRHNLTRLAAFLSVNAGEVAKAWAAQ
jgi:hypothetical protein